MSEDLENLEKSFILDQDMEHENIKDLIMKIQNYCKIDKNGFVMIDSKISQKMTIQDKILLALTTRHLANRLQQKLNKETTIKEEVDSQELTDMFKAKKSVIDARMKELKDSKQVIPVSRGIYKIAPYSISPFIEKLGKSEKHE